MPRTNKRFKKVSASAGGSLVGVFYCSYRELVGAFGRPNGKSDGYKVSTEWIVKDTVTGHIFTIYDYKATKLYSSSLPSVRAFRSRESFDWHIGGEELPDLGALEAFINGLTCAIAVPPLI